MAAAFWTFMGSVVLPVGLPLLVGLVLWRYEKCRLAKTSEIGPTCERCGYLLIGLAEPRCPECGEPFPKESIDTLVDELEGR